MQWFSMHIYNYDYVIKGTPMRTKTLGRDVAR